MRLDLIDLARSLLDEGTAAEIASVYGDQPVFPQRLVIEENQRHFPDCNGDVLLLSHENQGMCSWGLSLDGKAIGTVLVGGDLPARRLVEV